MSKENIGGALLVLAAIYYWSTLDHASVQQHYHRCQVCISMLTNYNRCTAWRRRF